MVGCMFCLYRRLFIVFWAVTANCFSADFVMLMNPINLTFEAKMKKEALVNIFQKELVAFY